MLSRIKSIHICGSFKYWHSPPVHPAPLPRSSASYSLHGSSTHQCTRYTHLPDTLAQTWGPGFLSTRPTWSLPVYIGTQPMHTGLRKIQILSPTAAGTRHMGCDPRPHSSLYCGAPHLPYSCCPPPPHTHTPPVADLGTYMFSSLNVSMVLGPHWLQWLTLHPTGLQPWPASSGWHPFHSHTHRSHQWLARRPPHPLQ